MKGKCCCGTEQTRYVLEASGRAAIAKPPLKCGENYQMRRASGANGTATNAKPPSKYCGNEQLRRALEASGTATKARPPSISARSSWRPSRRGESVARGRGSGAASSVAASAAPISGNSRALARLKSASGAKVSSKITRRSWSPQRSESAGRGGRRPGASFSASPSVAAAVPRNDRPPARIASSPPPLCNSAPCGLSGKASLCTITPHGLFEKAQLCKGSPRGIRKKASLCNRAPCGLSEKAVVSRMVSLETIRGAGRRRAVSRDILRWMARLGLKVGRVVCLERPVV